jgi:YD repeat-containing protein
MPGSLPPEPFQVVNQSDGPPPRGWNTRYAYDGSDNVIYIGYAQSLNQKTEWVVTGGGLVDIVVLGGTATATFGADHGLAVGHRVMVFNASDASLTGGIVATVPASDEITFATSAANGTYNNGALRVETFAPRTNDEVWAIKQLTYDVGNNVTNITWAEGQAQTARYAWDSRTTYAYQ